MKIALTTTGTDLDATVSPEFAQTPTLLIVTIETMEHTAVPHTVSPGSDLALAETVVAQNCEAVITGKIDENAFDILADNMITRYNGAGMGAREALDAMENRALKFIRNPEGTDSCSGDHHH